MRFRFGSILIALLATCVTQSVVAAQARKVLPAHPVDLNVATVKELQELPGVGPETAKAIVEFREKSGPFQRVEDLRAVKGISKKRLEALRPYVTVGPSAPRPQ